MIRFQATPAEKPAAAPTAITAKAPGKARANAAAPKEDLLDLAAETQDDKD